MWFSLITRDLGVFNVTFRRTRAVLFNCRKGKALGDKMPCSASGISSAICNKNTTALMNDVSDY